MKEWIRRVQGEPMEGSSNGWAGKGREKCAGEER